MKKILGNYLKRGIGILIPITLVIFVLSWLYNLFNDIVIRILPSSMTYEWWYVFIFVLALGIIVLLIGWLFSSFKLLNWAKGKSEKVVDRVPVVGTIYNFGKELVDGFISDVKEDGDMQVIEISFGEFKLLGVLTDEINELGFLLSAPSPLTGIVMKLPNYRKIDMTFIEAVKINTSLGKIGGENWK